ncbi:SPFH domain-containing protein [Thermosipho atlanticus]|uniref:SPFH domain, Band 7 family protein n=1 Tax=Thermosipho atlanticus DSM 15807 TaxID=1123380 RepID=A0A1M5QS00_9BACT|nr:SPFH domain-containing protein [Thermosipho atlanticus]SHH16636.1 SPFH domain, Band 7 family protein [Thermosipho atlanticus DSM 15807]
MYILFLIIILFLLILAASGIRIVRPYERGLVERLGKFRKEVKAGIHFIVPFFDRMQKVDLREHVIDVPPQEVITKDNVVVTVDAVIYYEITDAYKAIYNVSSFEFATVKLAQTNLRNVIGELELDQTLTSRERINAKLRTVLDEATDKWGIRITRVEIKKIDPPKDIMEAMSKQMKAERTKRAAILEAEGIRQSEILKAEGQKQAAILKAEGEAEAIKKVAEANKFKLITEAQGQGEAIMVVFKSIHEGNPTNDLLAVRYLETLKEVANGTATKIFLPMEVSGILGSIGAIGELFKKDGGENKDG